MAPAQFTNRPLQGHKDTEANLSGPVHGEHVDIDTLKFSVRR